MGSSAGGFGLDVAGQDDGVQGQASGEGGHSPNGDDDIPASAQHQAAVYDDPEELLVGPHGNLLDHDAVVLLDAGDIGSPAASA